VCHPLSFCFYPPPFAAQPGRCAHKTEHQITPPCLGVPSQFQMEASHQVCLHTTSRTITSPRTRTYTEMGSCGPHCWPNGTVEFRPGGPGFVESDGSRSMKFPWWRAVGGKLTITGRRLDASAPPLRAHIPEGYGDTAFQSTALIFPTEGCWEVTGRVGDVTLTFVTRVIIVGAGEKGQMVGAKRFEPSTYFGGSTVNLPFPTQGTYVQIQGHRGAGPYPGRAAPSWDP
jgi:hypothetical protein